MRGSRGPQAQRVHSFVLELRKRILVPIIMEDERLTIDAGPRGLEIERSTLGASPGAVEIIAPSGARSSAALGEAAPGLYRGEAPAAEQGLYEARSGNLRAER